MVMQVDQIDCSHKGIAPTVENYTYLNTLYCPSSLGLNIILLHENLFTKKSIIFLVNSQKTTKQPLLLEY